jgi:hypothetical protein
MFVLAPEMIEARVQESVMKIRFTEDYNANGKSYKKGREYDDVPPRKAAIYVRSGVAKAADAEAKAVAADQPAAAPAEAAKSAKRA